MLPLPIPPFLPALQGLQPEGLLHLPNLGSAFQHALNQVEGASPAQPSTNALMAPAQSLQQAATAAPDEIPMSTGPMAGNAIGEMMQPLSKYLSGVNRLQLDADHAQETFAAGGDIDIHDVMIATEKASIAMQLTTQIRNKLVDAYQEISRMQV